MAVVLNSQCCFLSKVSFFSKMVNTLKQGPQGYTHTASFKFIYQCIKCSNNIGYNLANNASEAIKFNHTYPRFICTY